MKSLLKFNIFAHRGPVKTWNIAKSRSWSRDENFAPPLHHEGANTEIKS